MGSSAYAPSEAAIQAAIERRIGSPGFFQRIAEQLARAIYPDIADGLAPFGRRTDDKTISGWPDAYLTKRDGTLIAIEATTAGNARTDHWRADLVKLATLLPLERRGGLIWVAWCDPGHPTDAVEMRDQACQLGLPFDDINIVFRKELCARLRVPYHARFWTVDLGLKVTCGPFTSTHDVVRRVHFRQSPSIFPMPRDFEESLVYTPPLLYEVETTLAAQRAAIVVGHGAAGKTTLAMILAHRPRYRHAPSYYLDLTGIAVDSTLAERAAEALMAIADRGVLFIIDNAHLDPSAAIQIFEQWEALGGSSELLILTRRVRAKVEIWDAEPEPEAIPVRRFDLVIEPADLEGVYRRHYRVMKTGEAPVVQPNVLARWYKIFGGDLLVFSAAVLGLLNRGGDAADVGVADARAFILDRYLNDPVLGPEQSALLDLAAVAEIEGLVPLEAFAKDALKECIRRGFVWVETRGPKGAFAVCRLAHPGFGTLLRDAAGCISTSRDDRVRVLKNHPYACVANALGLRKSGNDPEAKALLEALWRDGVWPLDSVPVFWWRNALIAIQELQLTDADEISARSASWVSRPENCDLLTARALATPFHYLPSFLKYADAAIPEVAKIVRVAFAEDPDALVKQALATPLYYFASFFDYADSAMPEVAKIIRDGLAENPDALAKQAQATPLHFLPSFLKYADTAIPEAAKIIRDGLAKDPDALVKRALVTPFNHLASFLSFADKLMPEVAKIVRVALADDPDALVKRALATPFDHLASFLAYAGKAMPEVARIIRDELAKDPDALVDRASAIPFEQLASLLKYADTATPGVEKIIRDGLAKDPDALVKRALATPFEHLASFLSFADKLIPEVANIIRDGLAKDPDALVKRALATPFDHLASFLAYSGAAMPNVLQAIRSSLLSQESLPAIAGQAVHFGPEKIAALCKQDKAFALVLSAIDAGIWSRRWTNVRHPQPSWFVGFALSCYQVGRDVLVGPIAEAIIRISRPEDLPSPSITVRHLSFILTSPHACDPHEVAEFIARCFPTDWFARQYISPQSAIGPLAGAVRAVAMGEREWLRVHFFNPTLARRLDQEQPTYDSSPRHVADWLQLLSATRLLDSATLRLRPIGSQLINDALRVVTLGPPDQHIQPMQAGLWTGLREWCHLTGQQFILDPQLADGILARFQVAAPVGRPRMAAMNAVMADWLERCEAQGWRTVVDQESLLHVLERRLAMDSITAD